VFWLAGYSYSHRGKEEVAKVDNLFIDIGCETKEQVDKISSCRLCDYVS
jgi:putative aminopeptidase FrvX